MKQTRVLILASAIILAGCASVGAQPAAEDGMRMDGMMGGSHGMMKMDSNSDGKITKEEFMKSHEAMFDMMKGKDGTIDAAGMGKRCNMMHGMMMGAMQSHGGMPK
ncbi:hypothetical protein [Noviherbaspirillum suwonense]|uniref:EF hand n=1 Tax=Noviherbaspirillum suwonense TaxID=1224511 RepID=A0ABY1QUY0_9BURK|nr:hypothetical protein [Noviherbaspirillum suwonense]SMP81074.1 EF hand [Noviherbaspirillum suwonense]